MYSVIEILGQSFFAIRSWEEGKDVFGGCEQLLESRLERGVLEWCK
jgi:hypothetical protein